MAKLIRERFSQAPDPFAANFVASIRDDEKLLSFDIEGTRAHVKMLRKVKLINATELRKILAALDTIEKDLAAGKRKLRVDLEDVHMNVEKWITDLAGQAGAKVHTARSRNDQVALDLRLYVRDQIQGLQKELGALKAALIQKASKHVDIIMPGYTHLQRAQPILFSHALLSFHDMIARDSDRFADAMKRVNISPLGACAMAGTSLPIDTASTAKALGFDSSFTNSIDAVSDRDFAVEFVSACAILQAHLSQIAENLVLWSSTEFNFVELPDELCTSSSIMPQKKNPDMIELVRGKAGIPLGGLVNLLTTLKALPLGYNRDLQETKPPVFEAAETARASVYAITLAMRKMRPNTETMRHAAEDMQLFATDLAEVLVKTGVPFREAHGILARLMKGGADAESLKRSSHEFGEDVSRLLYPEASVGNKQSQGGTGVKAVRQRLKELGEK